MMKKLAVMILTNIMLKVVILTIVLYVYLIFHNSQIIFHEEPGFSFTQGIVGAGFYFWGFLHCQLPYDIISDLNALTKSILQTFMKTLLKLHIDNKLKIVVHQDNFCCPFLFVKVSETWWTLLGHNIIFIAHWILKSTNLHLGSCTIGSVSIGCCAVSVKRKQCQYSYNDVITSHSNGCFQPGVGQAE